MSLYRLNKTLNTNMTHDQARGVKKVLGKRVRIIDENLPWSGYTGFISGAEHVIHEGKAIIAVMVKVDGSDGHECLVVDYGEKSKEIEFL